MNIPLMPNKLSLYGEQLSDLINAVPYSAHVRDTQTDKFIMANHYQAINKGFKKAQDIIGLTLASIDADYKRFCSRMHASSVRMEDYLKLFETMNYKVESEKTCVNFKEPSTLVNTGFVFVGNIFKSPILGQNQQVVAVLTYAREITSNIRLENLYYLYREHFSKDIAIQQFLRYLKLDNFFNRLPTEAELLILLALRQAQTHQFAADLLGTKRATFESRLQRLCSKLKTDTDLNKLLMHLRNLHLKYSLGNI